MGEDHSIHWHPGAVKSIAGETEQQSGYEYTR
jgi:hypothetical protein